MNKKENVNSMLEKSHTKVARIRAEHEAGGISDDECNKAVTNVLLEFTEEGFLIAEGNN